MMTPHNSDNADHELRIAYNSTIETGLIHFWNRHSIPGVYPDEVITLYKHAFQLHRDNHILAAERWARSAKHLSRAMWHEAKIAYLESKAGELPFLPHSTAEEVGLNVHSDTTADLLDSLEEHVPPGLDVMPEDMKRYLARARNHLRILNSANYKHELLRSERIQAAYEYGRVIECLALAYEADGFAPKAA
jgi:hypothetical protein